MKFEKEALSKAIKAKLTAGGKHLSMSEKTLNDMVSNHYQFVTEETELDDFVQKILPTYESLEGNYRKDNADFAKKWKEEHPEPTPDKDEVKKDNEKSDDVTAKLLARLEALENNLADREQKALLAQKKADLKAKLKEKGIDDDEWAEDYISGLTIDKDTDVDSRTETALKLFNKANSHAGKRTPGPTGSSDKDEDITDALKSLKSHMGINAGE